MDVLAAGDKLLFTIATHVLLPLEFSRVLSDCFVVKKILDRLLPGEKKKQKECRYTLYWYLQDKCSILYKLLRILRLVFVVSFTLVAFHERGWRDRVRHFLEWTKSGEELSTSPMRRD